MEDKCKHCGACRNHEICSCCGCCRNCGQRIGAPPVIIYPSPNPWNPYYQPVITFTTTTLPFGAPVTAGLGTATGGIAGSFGSSAQISGQAIAAGKDIAAYN
jgi:hypothetical protein